MSSNTTSALSALCIFITHHPLLWLLLAPLADTVPEHPDHQGHIWHGGGSRLTLKMLVLSAQVGGVSTKVVHPRP